MDMLGYSRMRKSLELLASEPITQREYLEKLGTAPSADELALEFDDAYQFFRSSIQETQMGGSANLVIQLLDKINGLFDAMGKENDLNLWRTDALHNKEWSEIRHTAKDALSIIGTVI